MQLHAEDDKPVSDFPCRKSWAFHVIVCSNLEECMGGLLTSHVPAKIIILPNFHSVVSQDVVGRHEVKIKIGENPFE